MAKEAQIPIRQVRAQFDDTTVTVYQAFHPSIAVPAARTGTFLNTGFSLSRMTWIKPSFLWMMYRSGWATKPGQERVLSIRLSRSGFDAALEDACLSHFDPAVYQDRVAWASRLSTSSVRIQWDPERDLDLNPLGHRSLQIGLAGWAANAYVNEWIRRITDVTELAHAIRAMPAQQRATAVPDERTYPLPAAAERLTGASRGGESSHRAPSV